MGEPAEIIKKFTFVSKDRKETCEIKIAELLGKFLFEMNAIIIFRTH